MALDYYSATRPTALAAALDATATTVLVLDGSSYPDPGFTGAQYTILIGYGSDREEVCTVTAKPTATSLTVVRAQDGTPATPKNAGDTVVHGVSARDFKRINTLETGLSGNDADIAALQTGKLDKTGGTLTGPLTLPGDAVNPLQAVTLQQAQALASAAANTASLPVLEVQWLNWNLTLGSTVTAPSIALNPYVQQGIPFTSDANSVTLTSAHGVYQATLVCIFSDGTTFANGVSTNLISINSTTRTISCNATVLDKSPSGVWCICSAPGITSGAAGALVPALTSVTALAPLNLTGLLAVAYLSLTRVVTR